MITNTGFEKDFADALTSDLQDWAEDILVGVGRRLMNAQEKAIRDAGRVDTGDLVNSIGFRVGDYSEYVGGDDPKWDLPPPGSPLNLVSGTSAPHAFWALHGMLGYDGGSSDNPGGAERIYDWAIRKGYSDADAKHLVSWIMENGTQQAHKPPIPFQSTQAEIWLALKRERDTNPIKVGRKITRRRFVVKVTK